MKPLRPMTKKPMRFCTTCDNRVGEEQWCEGCGSFICEDCDQQRVLPMDHEPGDHGAKQGTDDSL